MEGQDQNTKTETNFSGLRGTITEQNAEPKEKKKLIEDLTAKCTKVEEMGKRVKTL